MMSANKQPQAPQINPRNSSQYQIDSSNNEPTSVQTAGTNNSSVNSSRCQQNGTKLPCLVELSHEGFDVQQARRIQLASDHYDIGMDKFLAASQPNNYIRLDASIPGIEKKHCSLKRTDSLLVFIPYAECYINDRLCKEPTQLMHNFTIRLGKHCLFRVELPDPPMATAQDPSFNAKQGLSQPMASKAQPVPANYGTLYDGNIVSEASEMTTAAAASHTPTPSQLQPQQAPAKPSEGLPGLLEFPDDGEDSLLGQICSQSPTQLNMLQFKLAPVYTMYMMLRFRLSQKYKSNLSFNEKLTSSSLLIHKMVR